MILATFEVHAGGAVGGFELDQIQVLLDDTDLSKVLKNPI